MRVSEYQHRILRYHTVDMFPASDFELYIEGREIHCFTKITEDAAAFVDGVRILERMAKHMWSTTPFSPFVFTFIEDHVYEPAAEFSGEVKFFDPFACLF